MICLSFMNDCMDSGLFFYQQYGNDEVRICRGSRQKIGEITSPEVEKLKDSNRCRHDNSIELFGIQLVQSNQFSARSTNDESTGKCNLLLAASTCSNNATARKTAMLMRISNGQTVRVLDRVIM